MKPYLYLLFMLALGVAPVTAQDAEGYFHAAAQEYVGGQLDAAIAAVDEGLRLDPEDPKLQALKEKLEEERQQQQTQQNSGPQDESEQEGQQDQPQHQEGEQQEEQPSQGQQQEEQQGQQPSDVSGEGEQDQRQGQGLPQPDPDQLSPEQAARILQALGSDEEQLLREVMKLKTRPRRVEKDW